MDSSRGSQAGGKAEPRQQAQPSYEPFHPTTGWAQDKEKHILLVHLPGFNDENIRVQVDNSGKLTVTGTKKVGEGRYMRVEETYKVPKTSSIKKISRTFEDGLLRLIMLKVAADQEEPQKTIPSDEKKKATEEKEAPQKMIPSADEKKKEVEEKEATQKIIPSEDENNKELEKKEAPQKMIHEKKKEVEESKKEEEPVQGFFKMRIRGKEGNFRKDREEGWLDYELVDILLEKINKNGKVIAVAVAAFSVGFYVSNILTKLYRF